MGKGMSEEIRASLTLPDLKVPKRETVRGAVLGLAAGDALGAPIEGRKEKTILKRFKGPLTEIRSGRGKARRAGRTTDDTALTVALMEAMIEAKGYDPKVAMQHYTDWFYIDGRGMGSNTKHVFRAAQRGEDPAQAAEFFATYVRPDRPPSNGAIMRAAPLAIWYQHQSEKLIEVSREDANLTHYGEIVADANAAYNCILQGLLNKKEPKFPELHPEVEEILWVDKEEAKTRVQTKGTYVLNTLAPAVYAWREGEDTEATLVEIVNWGGDADTNAAVVGALLGIRNGYQSVPRRWLNRMEDHEYLVEVSDRFYEALKARSLYNL